MLPKPEHLSPRYSSIFNDASVVDAYAARPPYPVDIFRCLADLVARPPGAVLDVGCGTGDLAIPLSELVGRIDAADISPGMIETARRRAAGMSGITWILSAVEDLAVPGPYGLITAGESLHWMDWYAVLPRFADLLAPGGVLAVVGRTWEGPPALTDRVMPLIARYSTNREYRPYDLVEELRVRDLFRPLGRYESGPTSWHPTVEEYIECRHSQNGLSRERMGADATEFDGALRDALQKAVDEGEVRREGERLALSVRATVEWGEPLSP